MAETKIAKSDNMAVYEQVLARIAQFRHDGQLSLPSNYSAENAIKNAQLVISEVKDKNDRPALEVCTRSSIAQALLDTVLQGLNPMKKQCYYIVYGDKLLMQRSRYGEEHLAKSVCPSIEGIYPEVVYKGDVFKYSKKRGVTVVDEHTQVLENIDSGNIIAAYCTIVFKDGHEETTIMTIDEIHAAWRKSPSFPFDDKGNLKPKSNHAQFPSEMCKKTVVRRACKPIINSSDDSNLKLSFYRTDDQRRDADTDSEIADNNGILDVDFNEPDAPDVDPATGEVVEPDTPDSASAPY